MQYSSRMAKVLAIAIMSLYLGQHANAAELTIHPAHLADADLKEVTDLIEAGANVNARHIGGGTALHHLVIVSADMGSAGQRMHKSKIYFAGQWSASGHLPLAEKLLAAGADVNATDTLGQTPLHIAALTGHAQASRFLLANGATVNFKDNQGRTPLDIAKWSTPAAASAELAAATGQAVSPRAVRLRARSVLDLLAAFGAK